MNSILLKIRKMVKRNIRSGTDFLSRFPLVILPRMDVKGMLKSRGLAEKHKAVLGRLSHLKFFDTLQFKMGKRGKSLLEVSEAYTTRTCSECGRNSPPGRSRTFNCFNSRCSFKAGRDENAAINIAKFAFARLSSDELDPNRQGQGRTVEVEEDFL